MPLPSSLVSAMEGAQMDEDTYLISAAEMTIVEKKTEIKVEEGKIREEEVQAAPDISPPQSLIERDDDWFVLLDVIPRQTSYLPPGIVNLPCAAF